MVSASPSMIGQPPVSLFANELTRRHHGVRRERRDKILRIRLVEPLSIVLGRKYCRHAVVDRRDELVGRRGDDRERAQPLARRVLPALPWPGEGEQARALHADRVGLLFATLELLPFI